MEWRATHCKQSSSKEQLRKGLTRPVTSYPKSVPDHEIVLTLGPKVSPPCHHLPTFSNPPSTMPACGQNRTVSRLILMIDNHDQRRPQKMFDAALRVLREQMCCRCRSSWSFVVLRGQKEVAVAVAVLRGPPCPPWTNVLPLQFFVALRGPSWKKVSPHSPFEDRPNYALAYLSSDKRQRALVTPPVRGISLSPLPYPLPPAVLAFEAGLRPCEPIRR